MTLDSCSSLALPAAEYSGGSRSGLDKGSCKAGIALGKKGGLLKSFPVIPEDHDERQPVKRPKARQSSRNRSGLHKFDAILR